MQPPYLTDAEVAEICRPRKQGAAQIKFLRALGLKVARRADGTPLVWRHDVERRQAQPEAGATVGASNEPAWSRRAA
jgi:hypothetical protein